VVVAGGPATRNRWTSPSPQIGPAVGPHRTDMLGRTGRDQHEPGYTRVVEAGPRPVRPLIGAPDLHLAPSVCYSIGPSAPRRNRPHPPLPARSSRIVTGTRTRLSPSCRGPARPTNTGSRPAGSGTVPQSRTQVCTPFAPPLLGVLGDAKVSACASHARTDLDRPGGRWSVPTSAAPNQPLTSAAGPDRPGTWGRSVDRPSFVDQIATLRGGCDG
jgi:hypothetical protein